MGKYKYIKLIILILGLGGIIGGTILSAATIRAYAEPIDFIIDENTVNEYGFFENISDTTITGTILKPIGDNVDEDEERPCVFVFHGMFLNRFLQMQTAMYFAKAGMYAVVVDHAGQGESKGLYRLGYDLEALGKTVIDYFIDEGFKKYDMNVDLDALGVNGHSYGGITSTFAGINRQEEIKAVASIWSWSELPQTVTDITVGLNKDFEDDFINSMIYKYLTKLTGFGDALYYDRSSDFSTDPDDIFDTLEDRNAIDKVNFTESKPSNWLLISGYYDELITPEQVIELFTMASWNSSSSTSYKDLYEEIKEAIEDGEKWDNLDNDNPNNTGNFDDKNARKIFLPKDCEPMHHGIEGFLVASYVCILEWFGDAFDWDVSDVVKDLEETGFDTSNLAGIDGPLPTLALLKMFGWIWALLGLILAFPAIISYLIRWSRFKNSEKEYQNFIKSVNKERNDKFDGFENKILILLLSIYLVAEFFAILIPIALNINSKTIGIPFIISDALVLAMLGRFLIVIPIMIITLVLLFRKTRISFEDIGISVKKENILKDILLGIVIAGIFLLIFNLIAVISVSPRLIPRNSPSIGYLGFILLLVYLLIFYTFDEILFRGLMQTKIHNYIYIKLENRADWLKKWLEFIIIVLFQGIILMVGINIGLVIMMGGIPPVLISVFLFMGILLALIPVFMNTYIYQRTKSIIPCIISSGLIMAFLLGGSFVGAITF
ncbi:MAG: alpha/beta hydrolase family protein [Promethearchaeota archaeon]